MKQIVTVIVAAVYCSVTAVAGTFDDVVGKIIGQAPEYTAMLKAAEAATIEAGSAANLPDPEVEGEYLFGRRAENRWNVGVTQSFDWPGVYSARRKAARVSALVSMLEAEALKKTLATQVRLALVDYVNACRNLEVLAEVDSSLKKIETLINIDNGRQMTRLDLNKIKVERGLLQAKVIKWEDERTAAITMMQSVNPDVNIGHLLATLPVSYPTEILQPLDIYIRAIENDPAVKARLMTIEALKRETRAIEKERYPGFSLGYRHAYEEGAHFNGLAVGVTLPVFSTRHRVAAARAKEFAAEAEQKAFQTVETTRVGRLYSQAAGLQKSVSALAPVFEVYDNIALLEKAYKGGEISLINMLTEVNYFVDSRLEYLDLQYRYQSILANLDRYSGLVEKF